MSFSARVSYHFAVCSSLSIAINHFDTYTTDTPAKFVLYDTILFYLFLSFPCFRYTHAHIYSHMMRTITCISKEHAKYHGTTDYRCRRRLFPSFSLSTYAKLFLRLSSARRDDRLDVFRQHNTHHTNTVLLYMSIAIANICVRTCTMCHIQKCITIWMQFKFKFGFS